MVKINKIYTRTGDDGTTGLVGGGRVKKNSLRVAAYGDIDELNSFIGWAASIAATNKIEVIREKLLNIQQELFDIGAELATPSGSEWEGMSKITGEQSTQLEEWIDALTSSLPELRSFVLPGGTELHSALHIARTVCRRAERTITTLAENEEVSKPLQIYINRLSDLLFAMTRYESNRSGISETLWVERSKRGPA